MNHDPSPSSPAHPDPDPASPARRSHAAAVNGGDVDEQQHQRQDNGSAPGSRRRRQEPHLSKKAKAGLTKKLDFLLHLLLCLDTLIYAELGTLYYMDCSFFRLMIRWIPHWLFLGVKADHVILPLLNYPVGLIVGANALCMLLHLATALPTAGEAARGYLHGGVLVDFVGQKPPSSRLVLLLLDAVVLALQCVMLAVSMEKDRVKKIVSPPQQPQTADAAGAGTGAADAPPVTGQDHDAEERGVLRDAPAADATDDIEMQPLGGNDDGDEERSSLLGRRRTDDYENLEDVLSSGNAILADLHVRHALRTAWTDRGNTSQAAAAYTLQNVGYNATLAALAAQRRARLAAAQTGAQVGRS
ncbi:hypothetical protein JX266_013473 [Neoarthrinium moseri]|nr:hypothetical protein JX266_013473 [Neoarthrinium moseri]